MIKGVKHLNRAFWLGLLVLFHFTSYARQLTVTLSAKSFIASSQFKICGGFFLAAAIIAIIFYFRKKTRRNNDLTDTSHSAIININTGRILLFFGSITISAAAFSYAFATSDFDDKLYLSIAISVFLLAIGLLSFFNDTIKGNISSVLTAIYALVVLYFVFLAWYSNLNPFFIICQVICLSAGTVIFDRTKHFVGFAIFIVILSITVFLTSDTLEFSPLLYLLATISILFVSIVGTYIRLRLSDRLMFANTVVNDGSSIVMASDKNGNIIYINKRFTEVMGYSEKEVLGQGWWKVRKVISNDNDPYNKIR